jgi:hypothetical protein
MDLLVLEEEIWAASIDDKPGALGHTLSVLADAGANLDFVIVRKAPEKPGTGVVFVTPLHGDREVQAASLVGFSVTSRLHSVRIEGASEPGILAKLTKAVGDAGINLRGMSAATIGSNFIAHFGVDSAEDEAAVIELLSAL